MNRGSGAGSPLPGPGTGKHNMITSGTLLIEKNTPKPACFQFQRGSDSESWAPVTHDLSPRDLEKALAANGWTFHYLAGAIRATALGSTRRIEWPPP